MKREVGEDVHSLKTHYSDGTTHVALDPLDFISRLASLVPPPWQNLTRYYGVFATASKHRAQVMLNPGKPDKTNQKEKPCQLHKKQSRARKMTWSQRLARVFQIDITTCPHCSGEMKIIACVKDPHVIKKILNHLDIQAEDNPLFSQNTANPRAPPETEHDIWFD